MARIRDGVLFQAHITLRRRSRPAGDIPIPTEIPTLVVVGVAGVDRVSVLEFLAVENGFR